MLLSKLSFVFVVVTFQILKFILFEIFQNYSLGFHVSGVVRISTAGSQFWTQKRWNSFFWTKHISPSIFWPFRKHRDHSEHCRFKNPGALWSLKTKNRNPLQLATLTSITDGINLSLETVRQVLGARETYLSTGSDSPRSFNWTHLTCLSWKSGVQTILLSLSLSLAELFSVGAERSEVEAVPCRNISFHPGSD